MRDVHFYLSRVVTGLFCETPNTQSTTIWLAKAIEMACTWLRFLHLI